MGASLTSSFGGYYFTFPVLVQPASLGLGFPLSSNIHLLRDPGRRLDAPTDKRTAMSPLDLGPAPPRVHVRPSPRRAARHLVVVPAADNDAVVAPLDVSRPQAAQVLQAVHVVDVAAAAAAVPPAHAADVGVQLLGAVRGALERGGRAEHRALATRARRPATHAAAATVLVGPRVALRAVEVGRARRALRATRQVAGAGDAEELGHQLDEEGAKRRQAGRDDADGQLEEGPIRRWRVVVGGVLRFGGDAEGLDPDDGDYACAVWEERGVLGGRYSAKQEVAGGDSQETQSENAHEQDLLALRQLQLLDDWQRHAEDAKVGDQVDARHDVPDGQVVEAAALDRAVPELGHRHAGQGQQEGERDRPQRHEDKCDQRQPLHDGAGEDAAVLQ